MRWSVNDLTRSALFMAMGILIPLLFHALGLGPMFLPMFWPLAMGGFFLPQGLAALTGALTPLLSSLMMGMPPVPIVYKMMVELAVLSAAISLLRQRTAWGLFWVLMGGMIFSLATGWLSAWLLAPVLGLPPALYAAASLIQGAPGIGVILVVIPLLLKRILHQPVFGARHKNVTGT